MKTEKPLKKLNLNRETLKKLKIKTKIKTGVPDSTIDPTSNSDTRSTSDSTIFTVYTGRC